MEPRPYQAQALDALYNHLCVKDTNPCVVLPTGSGKSAVMAWAIKRFKNEYAPFRSIVIAHRRELIRQNESELRKLYGSITPGIFSAGLHRKDYDSDVIFASIDSVYKHAGEFPPFDLVVVDEAHRIPVSGEGRYRTFISDCKRFNQHLRVCGFTATAFRLGCGPICHKDHILQEICYEANITSLIADGYLSELRTKIGRFSPNLDAVKSRSGGDYVIASLSREACSVVRQAVASVTQIIKQEQRQSILIFCVDINHCKLVSREFQANGIYAPCVTNKTKPETRQKLAEDFKSGKLHALCNVNVYTEGFNATCVDCVVLLRPTLSPGLFSQMVGRGLRLDPGKKDCLVLDFAGCIDRHGPIDNLGMPPVVMATCEKCRESFSRAVRSCPRCGWTISKVEVDRLEREEKAKRNLHGTKPSSKAILSTAPATHKVDEVYVGPHAKKGKPTSICVQYRCGLNMYREWVCLDHIGGARRIAEVWWKKRFPESVKKGVPCVADALENLFLEEHLKEWTKTITVIRDGKYFNIIGYNDPA